MTGLAIVVLLGQGITQLMVAIGITSIPVYARLVRGQVLSLKALDWAKVEPAAGATVRQKAKIVQGIESEKAKAIVRAIKDAKLKVQASIQSDQVRVVGRNKDDLQKAIALVREQDYGLPLQFTNYRG